MGGEALGGPAARAANQMLKCSLNGAEAHTAHSVRHRVTGPGTHHSVCQGHTLTDTVGMEKQSQKRAEKALK